MSINLLDMLKNQVSGSLVGHASKFLGESESATGSAMDGIFGTLLGKVADQGATEEGATGLMNMLKDSDAGMLDDIGGLFGKGAGSVNGLLNSGSGILSSLMGNKLGGIVDLIAGSSGLKKSSSSSLLKMAAPFLMSFLGRHVRNNGLNVGGLMSLLGGQKNHIASALPAGMGSLLGLSSLGSGPGDIVDGTVNTGKRVVSGASNVAGDAVDAGKKVVGGTMDAGKKVVGGTMDAGKKVVGGAANVVGDVGDAAVKTGGGLLRWLLPAAILLAALSFFGIKTCSPIDNAVDATKDVAGAVVDKAGDVAGGAADMAGDAMGAVKGAAGAVLGSINEAAAKTLEGIKFGAGSAGSQMMDFIKGGASGDGRFRFKNLNFASGSANISGETGVEVDNLASILKAYTDVKINVEGYTDSTGNAAANTTLSQQRADAVKARLVAQGISGDRIMTKGFGAANPVGDNATKEGQAQNRRIEVVIVK